MKLPKLHRLIRRRRTWIVVLTCSLGCIAAMALAAYWYNAAATDEDGPLWALEDLRSVRGPRSLWDFITGESGRQRRQILRLVIEEQELIRLHMQQVKALQEARTRGDVDEREAQPESAPRKPHD